ncbi:unnamed protein product [Owenia fusiformis]|uniref:Uncharacterized protein n=1 Tax=Owenia fusiformis TaxID=6347 RepID=A0A8J1TLS6_OWEFU|nr:unnamed protein product [Owenia fusiformis]
MDTSSINIYKNLLTLSLSFTLVFTAYGSLQNLISSLNQVQGLGVASLSCIYGGFILSCFFGPTLIKRLGYKFVFVTGWFCHCIFISTNFYPKYYTLVPSSILLGLISGAIWTAQGAFLTSLATKYATSRSSDNPTKAGEDISRQIAKFIGFFYMLFQSSQVWGNLISSLVLQSPAVNSNKTTGSTHVACGAAFCPYEVDHNLNASRFRENHEEPDKTVYILLGTYLGCDVLGIILTILFMNNINESKCDKKTDLGEINETSVLAADHDDIERTNDNQNDNEARKHAQIKDLELPENVLLSLWSTLKLMCQPSILLITPLFIFSGAEGAWLFGDFTQAFTTCTLGVSTVGYTMIGFGVSGIVISFLTSRLEKCIPRLAMFIAASILNIGVLLTVHFWHPQSETMWMFFLVPVLWGASDTIWLTQISSHIGINFSANKEDVFAIWRLWQAFGQMISFAVSHYVCMNTKLYTLMSMVVLSMVLFIIDNIKNKKVASRGA